jgi:hypothetical protein
MATSADRSARAIGLLLGMLLGLAAIQGLAVGAEPTPAQADARPTWLYDLPAEPAAPEEDETQLFDTPAEPAPLTELPETS